MGTRRRPARGGGRLRTRGRCAASGGGCERPSAGHGPRSGRQGTTLHASARCPGDHPRPWPAPRPHPCSPLWTRRPRGSCCAEKHAFPASLAATCSHVTKQKRARAPCRSERHEQWPCPASAPPPPAGTGLQVHHSGDHKTPGRGGQTERAVRRPMLQECSQGPAGGLTVAHARGAPSRWEKSRAVRPPGTHRG